MEKVKTLTVDLYKPSPNEEILYVVEKRYPKLKTYYYDNTLKYGIYLNLYNQIVSGVKYREFETKDTITVYLKNGKLDMEDSVYFYTFDIIKAKEKLLEFEKEEIEKHKSSEEEYNRQLYEEIKSKYADRDWFKIDGVCIHKE